MITDECVPWRGTIRPDGYGQLKLPGTRTTVLAHRYAWFLEYGFYPKFPEFVIDHLCRNRACVNVDHMEMVTIRENILRGETRPAANAKKTHCHKNHELAGENLYITPSTGTRKCRKCTAERHRENKARARTNGQAKPEKMEATG